jgi:hypothetical protein
MSFEAMEGQRRDTADAILIKFGASIEKAEQNAAAKTSDPALKKLMAARMALEYAVLATAREKNMATEVVAGALKRASIAQQAAMIKEGALGRASVWTAPWRGSSVTVSGSKRTGCGESGRRTSRTSTSGGHSGSTSSGMRTCWWSALSANARPGRDTEACRARGC